MAIPGYLFIVGGLFFLWVSALGLIRMPDFYTRMHAGTKGTTLGALLVLAGVAWLAPLWAPKLLLLGLFVLLTNPLSASVLARAAHHDGTPTAPMACDAYAEHRAAAAREETPR